MFKETGNLQFGEFTLNLRLRELQHEGSTVPVPSKAFDLLAYMASNPGRPLTKTELLEAVWPETIVEESNLSQNVFLLRKILGSGNDGPIKTLAGRGYQFAAEVIEAPSAIPAVLPHQPVESQSAPAHSMTVETTQTRMVVEHDFEERISLNPSRRAKIAAAAIGLMAILALGGWFVWQHWLDKTGGEPVKVILTNLEGTTGDAALDRSLSDALRIDLAQSPFVSVVSTSMVNETLSQMTHKPDEVMSPATAREVCERTNSQAVLSGNIAKVGQHFLVTEQATSCVDGSVIAQAKREANTAEDLPSSIDKLAESLRQKLGESRRSIARFSKPLFPAETVSLEALKEQSEAGQLMAQGKHADAIVLLKKAVAADPNFVNGYVDLAMCYISTGDTINARTTLEKAYSLRDSTSEPIRFAINSEYFTYATQDLFEAEKSDRSWTELYPKTAKAWNSLYLDQRELGHSADAVESAKRVVDLAPAYQGMYVNLAYSQLHAGDIQGARATLDSAVAKSLDGDDIRALYIDVAVLLDDDKLLQTQHAWGVAHPQSFALHLAETELAIGQGRLTDARVLLSQTTSALREQGLSDLANLVERLEGLNFIESGDEATGTSLFKNSPPDPESGIDLIGLALTGEPDKANAGLRTMRAKYPQGTLWNLLFTPRILATIAMKNHKPAEAAEQMETSRPLEGRDIDIARFRGDTYLAAGNPLMAEKEYRSAISRRFISSKLGDYPRSWLGLGRALAAQGKRKDAMDAYQHFLTLWTHADPGALYLMQAKKELAKLQTPH